MAQSKKPAKNGKGKKKYTKPKMTRHGNLETVAERITGLIGGGCCVTERIRASQRSPAARARLIGDVALMVTASR